MRFSFPIPTPTGGEYTSADALFKLLEKETAGTYLLGKSNFWHGGVHFTDQSAPHCKDKHMVRCMGDGEVVAYRQLSEYKATPWAGSELKYSSGFCLVRHRYTSPENTSDGPRKGQKNELTFFSVYMHLAPMNAYPAATTSTYRIKIKASDLKVRERAEVGGNGIGKIQRGAELEIQALEEINSGGSNYLFATAKLCSGKIHYNDTRRQSAVGDTVTLALRQRKADNTTAWFADFVQDSAHATPVYWQGKKRALVHRAVNLRDGDTTPGAVVATLPVNSEVEYDPAIAAKHTLPGSTQQWLMARCKLIRNAGNSDLPAEFWLCVAPDFVVTRTIATPQLDTVVTCNQRIKAGDPIGFMGLHETAKKDGGKHSKHQVHVEIFSTDTRIKDFLQNKAEVTQGTQYLNIAKGTQLHAKSTATPPTFTAGDQTVQNDCIVSTSDCKKHKDAADKEWYEIKVKDGTATVSGCIAASDAEMLTQHDWEKLGFKIVEAPVDFDGHLDTMASQPFFKKLYQTITGVCAPPDRDKVRDVLTGQAYQSQRSKIVAYHPSEWKADSNNSLWSVLSLLLHKAPDRHAHEKERIDNCIWWDAVAGKVPELGASGMAWHWHPIGMVGQLTTRSVSESTGKLSENGIELLKAIEQLRLRPYDDQTGREIDAWVDGATVGYGHLISRREWSIYKNGVTEQQASNLFSDDLAPFERAVGESVSSALTQQQFDAAVILCFNIGIDAFSKSSVVKLLNNSSAVTPYDSLEDAWKVWNKSQGRVNNGLINRRSSEWNIFSKGEYERW